MLKWEYILKLGMNSAICWFETPYLVKATRMHRLGESYIIQHPSPIQDFTTLFDNEKDFSIMELKMDACTASQNQTSTMKYGVIHCGWNCEDFNLPGFLFRFWIFFSELQSSLGLLSNLQSKDYLAHNLTGQLYFFSSSDTTCHSGYSG